MTSSPAQAPRLWTLGGFRDDDWVHADTADALASNVRVILPLGAYLSLDDAERMAAKERIGVKIMPGESIDSIVPYLSELALVALAFPAFNDGRSFSKAELLRSRHGYEGTVRATGQVLVDQLSHMIRVGFDEFEVSHPVLLKRLEEGRIGGLPLYYQPTATQAEQGPQYSWRRKRPTGQ
jgi:uncharacterized protein (DUF934 family)